MKTNRLWSIMMMLVLVIGTAITFSSCNKDEKKGEAGSESIPAGLIGQWHSTNTGSTGRTCRVTFKNDYSVSIYAESRSSYKVFEGIFSASGSTITCKGVSTTVYSDGETNVDNDSKTQFTYSGSKLSGGFFSDCNQFEK